MNLLHTLIEGLLVILAIYLGFFKNYVQEKGKNLATKEDIDTITRKIEEVKAEIENRKALEKQKRELKFLAIMDSLSIIDAFISNFILDPTIKKQYKTTEDTRRCFNNLLLTCDDQKIMDSFLNIIFKDKPTDATGTQYVINELDNYRSLVRAELGFGQTIKPDSNCVWLGSVPFEK